MITKAYSLLLFEKIKIVCVILCCTLISACNKKHEDDLPIAILSTDYGEIKIEIDTKNAPLSGHNFIDYIEGGHFDDLTFYRSVKPQNDNHSLKISVLQGGINSQFDESFAAALPPVKHESTKQTGLAHVRGAVSLARTHLDTAQAEFFISTEDNPALDHGGLRHPDEQGFAVFGRVIEGMQVVDKIANLPADGAYVDEYVKGQILSEAVLVSDIAIVK